MAANLLQFSVMIFYFFTLSPYRYVIGLRWCKTGVTVFAEKNTLFFDYVHDNTFCLAVSLAGLSAPNWFSSVLK
jgi:hypothetical protein